MAFCMIMLNDISTYAAVLYFSTLPTQECVKYCNQHVCVAVCPPAYLKNHSWRPKLRCGQSLVFNSIYFSIWCLQCFDAVGWAAGSASGLKKLGGAVLAWLCLERGADLHMAQLMPLPLVVSCFSKIQIGFIFLVQAHPGSPGQRAIKWLCVVTLNNPSSILNNRCHK